MKNIVLTGLLSVFLMTACKKDDQVAEKSLEQQKIEFQAKQLEIEKQKLAIEKEKMAYESQKKADSIVESNKAKSAARNSEPKVITRTRTVYRDRESNSSNGSYANNESNSSQGTTQEAPKKKGMSKAAKGTIIGTVGGAAAGAIIVKKNRGLGAAAGAVLGGGAGYGVGRSMDKKDGRVSQ
jgi:sRNA-binding protein